MKLENTSWLKAPVEMWFEGFIMVGIPSTLLEEAWGVLLEVWFLLEDLDLEHPQQELMFGSKNGDVRILGSLGKWNFLKTSEGFWSLIWCLKWYKTQEKCKI